MPIRNIIFDFGGVIVDLNIGATVAAFERLGANVGDFIGRTRQSGLFADLELGLISEEAFMERLRAYGPASREAWCAMLVDVPARRLAALRRLAKTYHLSLLSNTNDIHWHYALERFFAPQGFRPEDVFEHVFLSQCMHLAKPSRAIFEQVLAESGYKPEETLFVDDSAENCTAFAALGVRTFTPQEADDWVPKVATIGMFDGVHRGHRHLLRQVAEEARRRDLASMVLTFDRHPRRVLDEAYQPSLLSTLDEKVHLIEATDIDICRVVPFTRELATLTAREFMAEVLRDRLHVEVLVMGYDHHFGHGGGTREDYVEWGKETGIDVVFAEELEGEKTSSSAVRRLLAAGDVEGAGRLLGYPYMLSGEVVEGRGVGHQLGFPTANIAVSSDKLPPRAGVYAVWAELPDGTRRKGMLNIGSRPTLHNGTDTTYEVNILDFIGDLYGKPLRLSLIQRLRSEQTFASLDALRAQLTADAARASQMLAEDKD